MRKKGKNFFCPEISTPNTNQKIQILLFIIKTRAGLINKMVRIVEASFPFSLYKVLLNTKILCALTADSTPTNYGDSY